VRHRLTFRNLFFIPFLIATNTFGNLLLAIAMQKMPPFQFTAFPAYLRAFLTSPWILSGVTLLVLWMLAQLSILTWADLSYVLPVTAAGYILTVLLGKYVLAERISAARWAGVVLISIGVAFVSLTPPSTRPRKPEEGEP